MQIHDITKHKGEFFTILQTTDYSQIASMTIPAGSDSGAYGQHPGDQIIYCIEGSGEIEIVDEGSTGFSAGQAFIIPAGAKHKAYANPDKDLFFVTTGLQPPSKIH